MVSVIPYVISDDEYCPIKFSGAPLLGKLYRKNVVAFLHLLSQTHSEK